MKKVTTAECIDALYGDIEVAKALINHPNVGNTSESLKLQILKSETIIAQLIAAQEMAKALYWYYKSTKYEIESEDNPPAARVLLIWREAGGE